MVLRSMFACGHFKHKGDAQQSLLSFSVGHHLAKTNKDKKGTEGGESTFVKVQQNLFIFSSLH